MGDRILNCLTDRKPSAPLRLRAHSFTHKFWQKSSFFSESRFSSNTEPQNNLLYDEEISLTSRSLAIANILPKKLMRKAMGAETQRRREKTGNLDAIALLKEGNCLYSLPSLLVYPKRKVLTAEGPTIPYKRILLKLSGESLSGPERFGISQEACLRVAQGIKSLHNCGVEIGLVIGGGNIFRGIHLESLGMARTPADQMGMLATIINGLALQQALQGIGCPAKVMSAIDCPKVVESYTWTRAKEYLSNGQPLIFVGGTGNPYFTTDTAAALRASEIGADALFKATKVDGIFNKDPAKHPDAVKYDTITYGQVLAEKLQVIDATAIAMCRNENIPIFVFNMSRLFDSQVASLLTQPNIGTLVTPDSSR